MMLSAINVNFRDRAIQQLSPENVKLLSALVTFQQSPSRYQPTFLNPLFAAPPFNQSFDPLALRGFLSQPMQHVPQMFPMFSALAKPLMKTNSNTARFAELKPVNFTPIRAPPHAAVASKLANRKRTALLDDDETASASSSGTPTIRTIKRERLDQKASSVDVHTEMGLGGESRLKINFSNLGDPGQIPQIFGKSRLGVPNGLSGTYVLYSERWRSETFHENESFESDDGTKHVLITWKITNLTSGRTQSRTETRKESLMRHEDGRTLCNKVFRRALEQRAHDLENDLKTETNPIYIKTMKNLVKKLRPKHFSEGPLVFGLRHEIVQNRFKSMTHLDGNGLLVTKVFAHCA